jgi:hypothetical protein
VILDFPKKEREKKNEREGLVKMLKKGQGQIRQISC